MSEGNGLLKPDENMQSGRIIIPPLNLEPVQKPLTLSLGFDGVIHAYSKGWADGSIYDIPIPGAIEFIGEAMWKHQFSIFVLSTRNSNQIKEWFDKTIFKDKESLFKTKVIPDDVEVWDEKCVLGITNRKLKASVYIDDKALTFDGNFDSLIAKIFAFDSWIKHINK